MWKPKSVLKLTGNKMMTITLQPRLRLTGLFGSQTVGLNDEKEQVVGCRSLLEILVTRLK